MYIENLALNNYRNYDNAEITFSNGINILYGDNAQGKTNILEAIYMTATTKSHRGSKDKEIIEFGKDESHIRTDIKKNDIGHRIDIHLRKNKSKGIAIDMIPIKRSADLFGMINIILFSPEDLSIIKNGPSERRRFMDMELCQLNRIYYNNLSTYNKILNQRNNQLKEDMYGKNQDILDVWDSQLIDYGLKIIDERDNFINMINEIIEDIHEHLTNGKEKLKLIYDKNVSKENFSIELCNKRNIDIKEKNNIKKEKPSFVAPEFEQSFSAWLEYKHQRRESYKSDMSLKACYNKLVKLAGGNPAVAMAIVEQSMANNWAGLFPLKNERPNATANNQPIGDSRAAEREQLARGYAATISRRLAEDDARTEALRKP